jgi:hypothetical protein
MYTNHSGAGLAALALFIGLTVTGGVGAWLTRRGTIAFPWLRSSSSNLIATRGSPRVWLAAHSDSKSQTIPMLARIGAVVVMFGAAALLGVTLLVAWLSGMGNSEPVVVSRLVEVIAIVTALAAIPFVFCLTGNRSDGAVDNASGVVSILLAVRDLSEQTDVGVIVTSAEEFGLAGARAHVESRGNPAIVLNCDTIDDVGSFLCMTHGRNRGSAAAAVNKAAARLGLPVSVRGTIPGILADGIAFADAGWDAVTVSRGNLSTLARVHTSGDTRERLDGSGIAQAARLLAATIEELR